MLLLWIACSATCPPGSSLQADGLCHLDPVDDTAAAEPDTDTGGAAEPAPAPESGCPDEVSLEDEARYPVYIDGTERRFSTIQNAIWGAEQGDVVVACPGEYSENIDFKGKLITVRSAEGPRATTIRGDGTGSVVSIRLYETPEAVLEGFTITGGDAQVSATADGHGGGVYVEWGEPTIRHNIIIDNVAMIGSGIYLRNAGARVYNNVIAGNIATEGGAGLTCSACWGEVGYNVFYNNDAPTGAAAEWFWGTADMFGNIFVVEEDANSAFRFLDPRDDFAADHNLLWPAEVTLVSGEIHSGGWPDAEWLRSDPELVDPEAGEWGLSAGSPAIDAGPPDALDADGSRADLGIFGGPYGDWVP